MEVLRNLPGAAWSFSDSEITEAKENNLLLNCDIEITKKCNLKCIFCYSDSGESVPNELTNNEIFKIISDAKNIGVKTITLTGGEPLAHHSFFEIANFVVENNMRCLFFTNANYVTPEIAKRLCELEVLPCVSLESISPHIHDKMVGVKGAFEKTSKGIEYLIEAGYTKHLPLTINSVITTENYSELPALWNWAKNKNIEPFLLRLIASGRGKVINHLQVSPEVMKNLIAEIAENEDFAPDIPFFGKSGCKKHAISCYIDAQGFVQPCSGLDITCGNIRHNELSDILMASPIIKVMRNIKENIQGKCKQCDHHEICYGCRGIAYGVTGDLVASDPMCWQ